MDKRVGYWRDVPLSIGAVFEDALALAWRMRFRIMPVIVALTIGSVLIDMNVPRLPMDVLKTTTALHVDSSWLGAQSHFWTLSIIWTFCSIAFVVVLTRMLFAAYHTELPEQPKRPGDLLMACFRLIGAMICYAVISICGVLPLAMLFGVVGLLVTELGDIGQVLGFVLLPLLAVFVFLYIAIVVVSGQCFSVGAVVRTDNLFHLIRDVLRALLLPTHLKRSFALGSICVCIIVLLSIICALLAHVLATLLPGKGTDVVSEICSNFTLTPILSAFAVVVYSDTMKRLENTTFSGEQGAAYEDAHAGVE